MKTYGEGRLDLGLTSMEALTVAMLKQAMDEASGVFVHVRGATSGNALERKRTVAEARAYLRSTAWHPLVEGCGADPVAIRVNLERKFTWMRTEEAA